MFKQLNSRMYQGPLSANDREFLYHVEHVPILHIPTVYKPDPESSDESQHEEDSDWKPVTKKNDQHTKVKMEIDSDDEF